MSVRVKGGGITVWFGEGETGGEKSSSRAVCTYPTQIGDQGIWVGMYHGDGGRGTLLVLYLARHSGIVCVPGLL